MKMKNGLINRKTFLLQNQELKEQSSSILMKHWLIVLDKLLQESLMPSLTLSCLVAKYYVLHLILDLILKRCQKWQISILKQYALLRHTPIMLMLFQITLTQKKNIFNTGYIETLALKLKMEKEIYILKILEFSKTENSKT